MRKTGIFLACLALLTLLSGSASAQVVHDVAVADVFPWPNPAVLGETVWMNYSVANEGNATESVTAHVRDLTDNVELCGGGYVIGPGEVLRGICPWDTSGVSLGDHSIEFSVEQVPGETDTADNVETIVVTVQEAVHDVAVNSVSAPSSADSGELVLVDVYVGNEGNLHEWTVQVVLEDLTDGVTIGSKSTWLYTWDTNKKVSFSWDTAGASAGNHVLKATAGPVGGETDIADNSKTTTVNIAEPPVYDGYISSLTTDQPKYKKRQTVHTTAVAANTGNTQLEAAVKFTYIKPDQGVAYTEEKAVSVPVSGSENAQSSYALPTNAARGTWTVKTELIYGAETLDTKTTTFDVVKKL